MVQHSNQFMTTLLLCWTYQRLDIVISSLHRAIKRNQAHWPSGCTHVFLHDRAIIKSIHLYFFFTLGSQNIPVKIDFNTQFTIYSEKLFILTLFITATFFTTSTVFAQMYQFSLNLNSTEIQFNIKLVGDKHCRCKEG